MWHGIVLDVEFEDSNYPNQFKIFAKRKSKSNQWTLFGVEVREENFEKVIADIQKNIKIDKPYYAHFYNDESLVVVFKGKVIKVSPHKSTWGEIVVYGKGLDIPEKQLDFWPNRFQDEIHYFDMEDFIK